MGTEQRENAARGLSQGLGEVREIKDLFPHVQVSGLLLTRATRGLKPPTRGGRKSCSPAGFPCQEQQPTGGPGWAGQGARQKVAERGEQGRVRRESVRGGGEKLGEMLPDLGERHVPRVAGVLIARVAV